MISRIQEKFLLVNRLKSEDGFEEKIQSWDSAKKDKLALPYGAYLHLEEGTLFFRDSSTHETLKSVPYDSLCESSAPFSVELHSHHQITIRKPRRAAGAFEDSCQANASAVVSSLLNLHLYEGYGRRLDHFQKIGKKWKNSSFSAILDQDDVILTPSKNTELLLNGKPFSEQFRISVQNVGSVRVSSGEKWWKFGYFATPMVLDESDYEELDPAEAKQDYQFKHFLSLAGLSAMFLVAWMTYMAPKTPEPQKILETAEIKIDRSMIDAKAIEIVPPKPVVQAPAPQPAEVKPAEVKPEVTQLAEVKPESTPEMPGVPKGQKEVTEKTGPTGVVAKAAPAKQRIEPKAIGNGKTGTGTPSGATGGSNLLTAHSKMLQDAFGSVLAMREKTAGNPAPAGAAGGQVDSANGAALGKGKGLFNTGSGHGTLADGAAAGGGVSNGLMNGSDPSKFVKIAAGGPLGKGTGNGGYGGGSGKIEVSGQGQGGAHIGSSSGVGGVSLTHAEVAAVFQKHVSEIRMCYESAMIHHPDLQGTVAVAFFIQPSGGVKNPSIQQSDLGGRNPAAQKDEVLVNCLLKRLSSWVFPKPRDGKEVQILSYPLVFKSLGNAGE